MRHPLQLENRLFTTAGSITVAQVAEEFSHGPTAGQLKPQEKLALVTDCPASLLAALTEFFATGREGFLTVPARFDGSLASELAAAGFSIIDARGQRVGAPTPLTASPFTEKIALQTTGSTGRPKIVSHSHRSLITIDPARSHAEQRWLVTYLPGTYAWYQMATLGLFSPGQHLIMPESAAPAEMWDFARSQGCTAISSTPTFWRCLFLSSASHRLAEVPLRQITLGGEPVDQQLLDQLHTLFPNAQLTHIYASTESGVALVVHDRREGFPLTWLNDQRPGRPTVRIQNGRLWIKSPYAAPDLPAWRDTGDRIEIRDERAVVVGRHEATVINVGGQKVDVFRVEEILRKHPQIIWCRVYGQSAPLVGQLVAAEVTLAPDAADKTSDAALTRFCHDQGLPPWMIPRLWNHCATPPLAANFKAIQSPTLVSRPASAESPSTPKPAHE